MTSRPLLLMRADPAVRESRKRAAAIPSLSDASARMTARKLVALPGIPAAVPEPDDGVRDRG